MSEPYVYAWAKRRGFFGRTGKLSHLLLDKGVLCVPETNHEEFVNEYARGVVQGGKLSCIVEYKNKSFRMFYDLDIEADAKLAKTMSAGEFPDDVQRLIEIICDTTATQFQIQGTIVTVCVSNLPKRTKTGTKIGVHLTFSNIFVTTPIALYVRGKVLEKLALETNPFSNEWDAIVDAAVHKGSGMRLPWAAKHDDPKRFYIPSSKIVLDKHAGIMNEKIELVHSFTFIRDVVSSVSLRSPGTLTKLRDNVQIDEDASPSYSGNIQSPLLAEYATVIEDIEKEIPDEYEGKITGVIKCEHVFMFRHSSHFCANVKRKHKSSNTYFLVSKNGMKQCCYSRKFEAVDMKEDECPCELFRGELIDLPPKVLHELFPGTVTVAKPPEIISIGMPTNTTEFTIDKMVASSKNKSVPRRSATKKNTTQWSKFF
jgi:hypothetical protein